MSRARFFNFFLTCFSHFIFPRQRHMWATTAVVFVLSIVSIWWCIEKGYGTESDCAIETAQWWNNRRVSVRLGGWEHERICFAGVERTILFISSSSSYSRFLCKFWIVSNDNQIGVQYLPSFLRKKKNKIKPKVFLNCMNGVRLSVGSPRESQWKTYRKPSAIVPRRRKKCRISLSKKCPREAFFRSSK